MTTSLRHSVTFEKAYRINTERDTVYDIPQAPKPGYMESVRIAPFNRQVRRIVGDPGDPIPFLAGNPGNIYEWGNDCRHHYSRDQAYNSTQKRLFLENPTQSGGAPGGSPKNLYLDAVTYEPLYGQSHIGYIRGDDRWHPSRGYANVKMNFKTGGLIFEFYDVEADRQIMMLPMPFASGWGAKGMTTRDGKYACFTDTARTKMFLVNLLSGMIGPIYEMAPGAILNNAANAPAAAYATAWGIPFSTSYGIKNGNVSITPSGSYVVVLWSGDYPQVYRTNLDNLTLELMNYGSTYEPPAGNGHGTYGFVYPVSHLDNIQNPFDADEDYIVGTEAGSLHGEIDPLTGQLMGTVMSVRLRDGMYMSLSEGTNEAPSHHTSCVAYDRPGIVVVGFYKSVGLKYSNEIATFSMSGSGRILNSGGIERLVHSRSSISGCYRCEEHPMPRPDGKVVLFVTNWASKCGNVCGSQAVRQTHEIRL